MSSKRWQPRQAKVWRIGFLDLDSGGIANDSYSGSESGLRQFNRVQEKNGAQAAAGGEPRRIICRYFSIGRSIKP